jgi:CheY-like chemotaxis protein
VASILVVDDNDDLRELICDVLQAAGHTTRTAHNGLDALRILDERFPQLVVSDVDMPVLSGPAMVFRMFVENLGRENIPVIVVSASSNLAKVAAAVGTPYYIAKPFGPETLLHQVVRALREATPPRPPSLVTHLGASPVLAKGGA